MQPTTKWGRVAAVEHVRGRKKDGHVNLQAVYDAAGASQIEVTHPQGFPIHLDCWITNPDARQRVVPEGGRTGSEEPSKPEPETRASVFAHRGAVLA